MLCFLVSFLFLTETLTTKVLATLIQPEWKIYYNMSTNQTIDVIDSNNPRVQYYTTKAIAKILRIGFGPIPCGCQDLVCGCCAGINIQYFDFNRRSCMNITYEPYDFALVLDMTMNDERVFSQKVSGKNPPPACMPVPLPLPLAPAVDLCVKFFNIHTPGYNLFLCMDFETRIARTPILVLHFDCMKMGADGIHHLKPEDAEYPPIIEETNGGSSSSSEIEEYDEVFEEDMENTTPKSTETLQNTSMASEN